MGRARESGVEGRCTGGRRQGENGREGRQEGGDKGEKGDGRRGDGQKQFRNQGISYDVAQKMDTSSP